MIKKSSVKKSPHEATLAIDYGDANIGTALGRNGFVCPLKIVPNKQVQGAINEIAKTIIQNRVSIIVVGLPLSFSGKETSQSKRVRVFAKLLKIRLKKPITFVDEFGTSLEAYQEAKETDMPKKRRRKIDHYSAAIILKGYYEQHGTRLLS
jgi:putative holliday junction resolvase